MNEHSFATIRAAAAQRPHGTRARYMGGDCRCLLCRAANSRYECDRRRRRAEGDWSGIVPASRARTHMRQLSRIGVGRNSVAAAADVSRTILAHIRSGRRRKIRASTERKILAVDAQARADGALVPAGPTWRLLDNLIESGYTKTQIAAWLGSRTKFPALHFPRTWIEARTASNVERLVRLLEAGKLRRRTA
jgi:hypothetical protein